MAQFDVHPNPIAAARRAYPFVVVLQAPVADLGPERIVAPVVPRQAYGDSAGRLTPAVRFADSEYVVIVPALAALPLRDLRAVAGSLGGFRSELLAAIDWLFFGV